MTHPYRLDASGTRALAARASSLAREVLGRHAADVDAARFPRESLDALAAEGFFGLCVPASAGGAGQGPRAFAAVVEELAQGCASTAMVYVMHVSAQQAIASSEVLAAPRRGPAGDRGRKAPDDARLLGEGLALAVLGAGLAASRSGTASSSRARRSRG